MAAVDSIESRNNTHILLVYNGQRVGRVQQFSKEANNNVQVLAELGRDYMVEMLRGIRSYSFRVSKFLVRNDVVDALRNGEVFSIAVQDDTNAASTGVEVLENFSRCAITSISESYTTGQATIVQDAQIVTIGVPTR